MPAAAPPLSPRLICALCLRPQRACICRWITPTPHQVEVVVLQHPLEVSQAKGSARLLHLSLPRSVLVAGEVFDEALLQALIGAPLPFQASAVHPEDAPLRHDAQEESYRPHLVNAGQPGCTLLLYPDSPPDPALGLRAPPALPAQCLRDPSRLRLIVLDGTWRKSRKMLYLNPLLQQLPRLALADVPASRYRIRKAHKPDQLSTLEATCAALAQLEGAAEAFEPLLAAFDGFVAQQSGAAKETRQNPTLELAQPQAAGAHQFLRLSRLAGEY
jgi:DTW domain-containing protein YfiP